MRNKVFIPIQNRLDSVHKAQHVGKEDAFSTQNLKAFALQMLAFNFKIPYNMLTCGRFISDENIVLCNTPPICCPIGVVLTQ